MFCSSKTPLVSLMAQQALTINVSLSAPRARQPGTILGTFTDEGGSWDRVPQNELWNTGPRYAERSGVRIGRSSLVPDWAETAPRNVSIYGLR
jgi:hypothetical protein